MQKKIPQAVRDAIKRGAESLPPIDLATRHTLTGKEIMENDKYIKFRSSSIIPTETYSFRANGSMELINHRRRMETIYLREGTAGVDNYVKSIRAYQKQIHQEKIEAFQQLPWYKRIYHFIISKF